jgi:acetate kinase
MLIMALNCGSSSVKYQLYNWEKKEVMAKGMVERVTIGNSFIEHEVPGSETFKDEHDCPTHKTAIDLIIRTITDSKYGVIKSVSEISAIGHRVVHGGEKFARSVVIDDKVLDVIKEVQHLAPLHNPPNIEGIQAAKTLLPEVTHVAVFDTAFHQTMPGKKLIFIHFLMNGMRSMRFEGTVSTVLRICMFPSVPPPFLARSHPIAISLPCI